MKNNYLFLLLLSALIVSCSSTNNLTMNATQPAPVYLSKQVQRVGIINRSIPDKKYEAIDTIDKILTMEGKELDKEGSEITVESLKSELEKTNRMEYVTIIDSVDFKQYGIDQFSNELSWEKINQICQQENLDAIYELSFYDTDSNIRYKAVTSQVTNAFGIKVPVIEQEATVSTLIKWGWRIYDNQEKVIRNVFASSKGITLTGKGINPVKAFETIKNRKDAVLNVSKNIGIDYTYRIFPYTIRVSREYFVRGTNNFEIGKRRARAGQWDSAAELWLLETKNKNSKIAGRAYYNMAIINEINGDLDQAINWATQSYTDYNNKLALHYLNILKNRKRTNQQLEEESQ
ncbi:DUF6340 family protein [Flavobacterium sp. NRK F10]|uniref:DUF6340 family protein n=1 Tax=Flavobacterium sp. NRK F10 TaxID=2954931 RepID=UPI002090FE54|nr:DUF6340 family protein [Flavobacterium sp. NRK F10]MCO6175447.1 DUF6340 family protein [Flavobacterium sp. NRK F10]